MVQTRDLSAQVGVLRLEVRARRSSAYGLSRHVKDGIGRGGGAKVVQGRLLVDSGSRELPRPTIWPGGGKDALVQPDECTIDRPSGREQGCLIPTLSGATSMTRKRRRPGVSTLPEFSLTTSTCLSERRKLKSRRSSQAPSVLQGLPLQSQPGELICVYARLPVVLREA